MVTVIQSIRKTFIGTSAETKPTTGLEVGDVWRETDTGKTLIWDGSAWKEPAVAAVITDSSQIMDGIITAAKLADAAIIFRSLSREIVQLNVEADAPGLILFGKRDDVNVCYAGMYAKAIKDLDI
ncbi:MAG: hypothetical protein ABIM44_04895, partial [candidate division WOR-3 bacterium]